MSSASREVEQGREWGHFALQMRPHNLVAPNALAYVATSPKGMACTPRDPKCGRCFFIFLDFGQTPPKPFLASCSQPRGGGGEGGVNKPSRGLEHPLTIIHNGAYALTFTVEPKKQSVRIGEATRTFLVRSAYIFGTCPVPVACSARKCCQ